MSWSDVAQQFAPGGAGRQLGHIAYRRERSCQAPDIQMQTGVPWHAADLGG